MMKLIRETATTQVWHCDHCGESAYFERDYNTDPKCECYYFEQESQREFDDAELSYGSDAYE